MCPHLCVRSGAMYVYTNIYIFTCVHIFIHMFTTMCQLECYQTCIHTYIRTCIHAYLTTDRLTTTPRPYAALRPHGHGVLDTCRHHDDANIVSKKLHHHLCQHQLVCRIAVPELATASIAICIRSRPPSTTPQCVQSQSPPALPAICQSIPLSAASAAAG